METNYSVVTNLSNHNLEMSNRKVLSLTGVKSVNSFDSQEFLIETTHGYLHIQGNTLSLGKMDTDNGLLTIKGEIESISYISKST